VPVAVGVIKLPVLPLFHWYELNPEVADKLTASLEQEGLEPVRLIETGTGV
jgi:hypothetical protein